MMYVVYEDDTPIAVCATHADAEEFALAVAEERTYVNSMHYLQYYSIKDLFIEKDAGRRVDRLKTMNGYMLLSEFYPVIEPIMMY